MNGANLRRIYESNGAIGTVRLMEQALQEGKMQPEDFSIKEIALAFLGEQWYESFNPNRGGGLRLLEAGEAVDSTAFSNIIGQLIFSKIMQKYNQEAFIADRLCETVPSRLSGEKFPGMGDIVGDAEVIAEGMPFPESSFGEDYIETPETAKRGLKVSVTKEAIFFDRTAQILRSAGAVGERLAYNKEKRVIDVYIGATNNYKRMGTSYNTYLTSGLWINKLAANPLNDWADIDEMLQLFSALTNPYNSEAIVIVPKVVLVHPAKLFTAKRILGATEVRHSTNSGNTVTISANPTAGMNLELVSSALAYQREIANSGHANNWYIGDPKSAFNYVANWGMEVQQAPSNSEAAFERDIVAQYRASERGVAAVVDPRYNAQATNS